MAEWRVASRELIVGGQKSGKSVRAECLARAWLQADASHDAILLATAQAWDSEMQARIQRHQTERAQRVPGMRTIEEPRDLAGALRQHSTAHTLIVVDCLTLWLTHWLMPMPGSTTESTPTPGRTLLDALASALCDSLQSLPGPVVVVSNEIGLGVIPMGAEVRAFVDALGQVNQRVAQVCDRVTLMAAGLPLTLKQEAA